jgi:hypothetical protein
MGKLSNQARSMPSRLQAKFPFGLGRSCILVAVSWIGFGMVATATPSLSGESGRGVSNRLESSPQVLGAPVLLAQRSRQMPVKFDPGKSSATIKNSVLRGTRDVYLLGASRQQVMTITLTSLENNAVFDLMAPPDSAANRRVIREGVRALTVRLPQSGEYQIVVGPTRGNASYRLIVSVK